MSADLSAVLTKLDELSFEELLTLQEQLTHRLKLKAPAPSQPVNQTSHRVKIPGAYRPTPAQIEARLAAILTPEELTRLGKTDFSKLPVGPKSASEMLNEDREDRF